MWYFTILKKIGKFKRKVRKISKKIFSTEIQFQLRYDVDNIFYQNKEI